MLPGADRYLELGYTCGKFKVSDFFLFFLKICFYFINPYERAIGFLNLIFKII